ncbi:MAG: hypothetical protein NXY59_09225 [Aigarchaeota archaeon]|nr:hypothetical protein [Candidatus Pelearchaeum maunauluense]
MILTYFTLVAMSLVYIKLLMVAKAGADGYGVEEIKLDPNNPDIIYAALGAASIGAETAARVGAH